MISRVRLDAYGSCAGAVEKSLVNAADSLDCNLFSQPAGRGQQVIERVLEEPDGSKFAFRGRLLLHPALAAFEDELTGTKVTLSRD